jgi:outer membrane biosynthesis protein TonB
LILPCCVLLLAAAGCGKSDQYPSAPALPTVKAPPPGPSKAVGVNDDDEFEDDDEEGDDENVSPTGTGRTRNLGRGRPMAAAVVGARPVPKQTGTINGHPGGPKAAVFNAVTNNAMPNAAPCFAKSVSGGGTVSVVVRMTVGNSGSVEKSEAVSGDKDPTLRKCLCDVVRRLTFPAFKGTKVTKTIPFTAVGGLSK